MLDEDEASKTIHVEEIKAMPQEAMVQETSER